MKLWASPKGDANNIRGSDRIIAGYRGMVRRESDIGSLLDTMGHGMLYLNLLRRGGGLGGIYYYRLRGTIWPNTTW